jgi:hypothetical protein
MDLPYTCLVRLNWNLFGLAMLTFAALLGAGCSGVNVGGSVSPASFFIPGAKAEPPAAAAPAPVAMLPAPQFAQVL